jgi:hypothetical protein
VSKTKKGTRTFGGLIVEVLKDFSGTRKRRSRDPSEEKKNGKCVEEVEIFNLATGKITGIIIPSSSNQNWTFILRAFDSLLLRK